MESHASRIHDPRQAIFKDGSAPDTVVTTPTGRPRIPRPARCLRADSVIRVPSCGNASIGSHMCAASTSRAPTTSSTCRRREGRDRLAAAAGVRLSRMLAIAEQNLLPLDVESALCVLRQLLVAMSELHDDAPDACHGTLAARTHRRHVDRPRRSRRARPRRRARAAAVFAGALLEGTSDRRCPSRSARRCSTAARTSRRSR